MKIKCLTNLIPDGKIIAVLFVLLFIHYGCQPGHTDYQKRSLVNNESVRKTATLSDNWKFQIDIKDIGENEKWFSNEFSRQEWASVKVPQAWDTYETALWGYEGLGWYSITIGPDDFIPGKRTEIIFNRVMFCTKVWMNGKYVGENTGGYLPFSFDVTNVLEPGKPNHLVIRVDNKYRIEWLPAANQVEWIQYGGILEPVELTGTSHTYIKDLTIVTEPVNEGARITCGVIVANESGEEKDLDLNISIYRGKSLAEKILKVHCKPNENSRLNVEIDLEKAELWSPESPSLYVAHFCLKIGDDIIDDISTRFGIRQVRAAGNDILLNGKPIILKGVNRYDEYGNFGPNPPEDLLRKELELMKSVGINAIRVHYPQSSDLLSLYDEYGFVMIEEVPLNWWGLKFGGEVDQNLDVLSFAKPELRKMIARDKNHPCVIIWSMGNECRSDNEVGITVMRELLRLAKSLDTTRLTTFVVALNPDGHLAFDEADIVSINKYNGSLAGKRCLHIGDIDSLGYEPLVRELRHHRDTILNKPIIITEFGTQGIKNIHGDVGYTEEFQAAYIERIWQGITSVPGVSGGTLWSWADYYHRKYLITYAAYGPYGVVTVDRQPKKSLESLARMYGGTVPGQ